MSPKGRSFGKAKLFFQLDHLRSMGAFVRCLLLLQKYAQVLQWYFRVLMLPIKT